MNVHPRAALCAGQRHREDSAEAPLAVSHQVGTGGGASAEVGEIGSSVWQNRVARGRQCVCQTGGFETVVAGRRGGGQPLAQRRRLVRFAAAPEDSADVVGHGSTAASGFRSRAGPRIRRAGRRSNAWPMASWSHKTIKTFLATYRPAGGVIRVVIVREDHGCQSHRAGLSRRAFW